MKIRILISFIALAAVFGCSPDENNQETTNPSAISDSEFARNFGASVSRDFIGEVVDTDNHPVKNASVKIGSLSAMTDDNGVFIINGASVYEKFAYVTATKSGYIDGSRTIVPTSGKNNIKIMLLQSGTLQTIHSGESSEVSIYSNTKVVFDGAFMDSRGNAYSGDVNVFMYHLTPSDPNINSLMPGMLFGQDSNGDPRLLKTYGMMNVELRGSAGQMLNIATGHTAKIVVRIDDSQLATAPATVPLWHFDAANGYWKMDGNAVREGSYYSGNVSHFSWWNFDDSLPSILLTVNVVDGNGNPTSYVQIDLLASGDTTPRTGYSDNNGQISGYVPSGTALTMTVYDSCGNVISTTPVGPFNADTVLPDVVVTGTTLVQGNLLKCDMTNVTNGYVMLKSGNGHQFASVTNGAFSFSVIACSTDSNFILQGVDYPSQQMTDFLSYNFITPITNVGNLVACTAITEFVSFQVDTNPLIYITDGLTATYNASTGLTISANSQTGSFTITGDTNVPGVYTTTAFSITGDFGTVSGDSIEDIVFSLGVVGNVGEYIDMTFSGTYQDGGTTHNISGVFHVIRDN